MKNIKQIRNYLWKELNKEDSEIYLDCEDYEIIVYALDEQDNKIIKELEKIREDIENIRDWVGGTKRYFSEDELNEIFDKYISKLKGE